MMRHSGSDIRLGKDGRQTQRPEPSPLNCQCDDRPLPERCRPPEEALQNGTTGSQARLASFLAGSGGAKGEALPPPCRAETHLHIQRVFLPGLITNRLPPWPDKPLSDLGLFPKSNLYSKEAGDWSPLKKFRE